MSIETLAGSTVQKLLGESFEVRCHHHQCVAAAPGHEITAWAKDGTPEAMEGRQHPFWLAVQWHPEVHDDARLFEGLVQAGAGQPGSS